MSRGGYFVDSSGGGWQQRRWVGGGGTPSPTTPAMGCGHVLGRVVTTEYGPDYLDFTSPKHTIYNLPYYKWDGIYINGYFEDPTISNPYLEGTLATYMDYAYKTKESVPPIPNAYGTNPESLQNLIKLPTTAPTNKLQKYSINLLAIQSPFTARTTLVEYEEWDALMTPILTFMKEDGVIEGWCEGGAFDTLYRIATTAHMDYGSEEDEEEQLVGLGFPERGYATPQTPMLLTKPYGLGVGGYWGREFDVVNTSDRTGTTVESLITQDGTNLTLQLGYPYTTPYFGQIVNSLNFGFYLTYNGYRVLPPITVSPGFYSPCVMTPAYRTNWVRKSGLVHISAYPILIDGEYVDHVLLWSVESVE